MNVVIYLGIHPVRMPLDTEGTITSVVSSKFGLIGDIKIETQAGMSKSTYAST